MQIKTLLPQDALTDKEYTSRQIRGGTGGVSPRAEVETKSFEQYECWLVDSLSLSDRASRCLVLGLPESIDMLDTEIPFWSR